MSRRTLSSGTIIEIDDDIEHRITSAGPAKEATLSAAKRAAEKARELAPVVTGAYRDGIRAEQTPGGARVIASDQKSHWVEFGVPSRGEPAQFVLRRAAEAAGLKLGKA